MPILTNAKISYWSHDGTDDAGIDVAITDARDYLESAGLNKARAEGIPDSTAFRRGIAKITGKIPETERVLFARFYTRKTDELLTAKVFEQEQDENGHLHAIDHSEYELRDETDTAPSCVRQVSGESEEYNRVRTFYDHATKYYSASDVTKIIQAVLTKDGLGAYPCKPNGGVYFVPLRPGAEDMLSKLTAFCRDCGTRFLTYDIPDVSAQRDEIAEAVSRSLSSDLDLHNAAITAYSADSKRGVLENRRTALTATSELIASLSSLLNGKATELQARITELRSMVDEKEKLIEDSKKSKVGKRAIEMEADPVVPTAPVPDVPATVPQPSLF